MKYMLMMNVPAGTGDYQIRSWTPEEYQAHIACMRSGPGRDDLLLKAAWGMAG